MIEKYIIDMFGEIDEDLSFILDKLNTTLSELQNGMVVQESSANVMAFLVQDLLDYAQIKAGKFRKNISKFDIRKSVETVMCIQRQKALDNNIDFYPTFKNIAETPDNLPDSMFSPEVCTDEERVMQVLLGLQSNALKFTEGGKVEIEVQIIKTHGGDSYL